MKTKLLRKLRRNAFLERRNSEYRAVVEAGMFRSGAVGNWKETKKEAENNLREIILRIANIEYSRVKI